MLLTDRQEEQMARLECIMAQLRREQERAKAQLTETRHYARALVEQAIQQTRQNQRLRRGE